MACHGARIGALRPPDAFDFQGAVSLGWALLWIFVVVTLLGLVALFVLARSGRIARLLRSDRGTATRPVDGAPPERDRELDGTQVAGMPCAACRTNILSDFDGMTCADCAQPIHTKCHGRHLTGAHGATTGAYR